MSLENEREKSQLPSCENRMSIKDRVLKILVRDYITILTNGEPTAEIVCSIPARKRYEEPRIGCF